MLVRNKLGLGHYHSKEDRDLITGLKSRTNAGKYKVGPRSSSTGRRTGTSSQDSSPGPMLVRNKLGLGHYHSKEDRDHITGLKSRVNVGKIKAGRCGPSSSGSRSGASSHDSSLLFLDHSERNKIASSTTLAVGIHTFVMALIILCNDLEKPVAKFIVPD
jgi:hypothetical protein